MDRTTIDWSGSMPALTTPFRADFSIDEEAFVANVDRLFQAGATGMVAAGCTGEFWSLTFKERSRLAALTCKAAKGRGPSIIGTGSIDPGEVIEQIAAAQDAGVDGALVLPPYFVHLTDNEIIAHFEAIDAKAALPIILYNIPGNAGNAITPPIADRLADLDHVVAIKESSGDWRNFYDTLVRVRSRIRVFCGPSSVFGTPAALAGADGFIDCFPNVWAQGAFGMWHAVKTGAIEEAWDLQRTGVALTALFTSEGRTLYPSTKAVMHALGLPGGGVLRPPLCPLESQALETLMERFRAIVSADAVAV